MNDMQSTLWSPFDIDIHNSIFHNYCEVIIHPNGLIEYAVPSHQEKLVSVAAHKLNCSHLEVWKDHVAVNGDCIDTLQAITGCVVVYTNCIVIRTITSKQIDALYMLIAKKAVTFSKEILQTTIENAALRGEYLGYNALISYDE